MRPVDVAEWTGPIRRMGLLPQSRLGAPRRLPLAPPAKSKTIGSDVTSERWPAGLPVGSVWEGAAEVTLNPGTSSLVEILPLSGKLVDSLAGRRPPPVLDRLTRSRVFSVPDVPAQPEAPRSSTDAAADPNLAAKKKKTENLAGENVQKHQPQSWTGPAPVRPATIILE